MWVVVGGDFQKIRGPEGQPGGENHLAHIRRLTGPASAADVRGGGNKKTKDRPQRQNQFQSKLYSRTPRGNSF